MPFATSPKRLVEYECPVGERLVQHMTTQNKGRTLHLYWTSRCRHCAIKAQCTSGVHRKMARWEHEAVLEKTQARLDRNPAAMSIRLEHPLCRYPKHEGNLWT
jgi:hypothetical protein